MRLSKRAILASAMSAAALAFSGCATTSGNASGSVAHSAASATTTDSVSAEINRAIEQQDRAAPFTRAADYTAPAARLVGHGGITVSYRGSAAELLSRLAALRGLSFSVDGPLPHPALYVALDVTGDSLKDVCRRIGMQFGQRADLLYRRTGLTIRYLPVTTAGPRSSSATVAKR